MSGSSARCGHVSMCVVNRLACNACFLLRTSFLKFCRSCRSEWRSFARHRGSGLLVLSDSVSGSHGNAMAVARMDSTSTATEQ